MGGKKKQQRAENQKTKLKVGRKLSKGQNVTNTSFKTTKIVTQDQLKGVPGELSLKDILTNLSRRAKSGPKTQIENLAKLTNYILENPESLPLFFPDALKKMGKMLIEDETRVRRVVIDVLHTALRLMTAMHVGCFSTLLTTHVTCMLTHYNMTVRKDALLVIDKILEFHPQILCGSTTILNGLLNLISAATQRGAKRQLNEHISSSITSQDWRMCVLSRVLALLNLLPGKEDDERDEQREVYWDAEKPLYLPLYLRGGLAPVPLDEMGAGATESSITNTREFREFVCQLIPLLRDVVKGELLAKARTKADNPVDPLVVKHLNAVVQILCCLGEWVLQKSPFNATKEKEFKGLIIKIVCDQLFKCFPYHQLHTSHAKTLEKKILAECMQLNLGICYLYCMFVLDAGTAFSNEDKMILYLDEVFRVCNGMCEKSVSLIIKVNKLCMSSPNVNETYKNGLMLGLYGILEILKLSENAKPLYSFFMDISLDYGFKHLLNSEAMKTWFNMILKEILLMAESNSVDKRFYKYVRQICARKYPYFLDLLNRANPENFLDLLKYDNEELHLTVTQMICCLEKPSMLLEGLTDVISEDSFSLRSAIRIVRQLHCRFSSSDTPGLERMEFLRFLLNLGCDTFSLVTPCNEAMESSEMLKSVMESCRYNLQPSTRWKRHLKITEVCLECLPCYWQNEVLVYNGISFLKSLLSEYSKMPIHCVVALLKLRKECFEIYQDDDLPSDYSELLFSCMMYLSVMLCDSSKKEALEPYAITELKNSLHIEESDANDLISIINLTIYGFGESELYHVLRITQFLIHQNILKYEDRSTYYSVLEKINEPCQRSNLLHPLWINICSFFNFF